MEKIVNFCGTHLRYTCMYCNVIPLLAFFQFFSSPQESFLCSKEAVYQQNVNVDSLKKVLCHVNFTALVEQIKNDWNWPLIRSTVCFYRDDKVLPFL